jgi:hypothetical protein
VSVGQVEELPVHFSSMSHSPVLARQTVFAEENWQEVQQPSFASSQTEPSVNLQVLASQHLLSPQPSEPPQSQSSPSSTMPLPHCAPAMVTMPLLSERHSELTVLRPSAEQTLPIVHCENLVTSELVLGFMM